MTPHSFTRVACLFKLQQLLAFSPSCSPIRRPLQKQPLHKSRDPCSLHQPSTVLRDVLACSGEEGVATAGVAVGQGVPPRAERERRHGRLARHPPRPAVNGEPVNPQHPLRQTHCTLRTTTICKCWIGACTLARARAFVCVRADDSLSPSPQVQNLISPAMRCAAARSCAACATSRSPK